jgi:hypothetical protein
MFQAGTSGDKAADVKEIKIAAPAEALSAAGDLAWRKLLPAVYNLNVEGVLPSHFATVAFGLPAEGATLLDPDEYIITFAQRTAT